MMFKQYTEIARGLKTLTQRVITPKHELRGMEGSEPITVYLTGGDLCMSYDNLIDLGVPSHEEMATENVTITEIRMNGRLQYAVGKTYAVVPGRGKIAVHYRRYEKQIIQDRQTYTRHAIALRLPEEAQQRDFLVGLGFQPMQITIESIRVGRLQEMTARDVLSEGVNSRAEYVALWDKINGAGAWDKNPYVARIGFNFIELNAGRRDREPATDVGAGRTAAAMNNDGTGDIRRRLVEARKARGLTQVDAAHAIGFKSRSSLSALETGKNPLTVAQMLDLANVYGVAPVWLLTGMNDRLDKALADIKLKAAARLIRSVTDELSAP